MGADARTAGVVYNLLVLVFYDPVKSVLRLQIGDLNIVLSVFGMSES